MKEFTYHLIFLLLVLICSNTLAQGGDEANNATVLCADGVNKTATISALTTNKTSLPTYPAPASCSSAAGSSYSGLYSNYPSAGGDIWFKVFVEQALSGNSPLIINTVAGTLNRVAMAAYTATNPDNPSTFTQIACSDNQTTANYMPKLILTTPTAGIWVYVRLWDENQDAIGSFQISATLPQRWTRLSALANKTVFLCQECPRPFTDTGGDNATTGNYAVGEDIKVTYCADSNSVTNSVVKMEYQDYSLSAPVHQQLLLQAEKTGNDYLTIFDGNATSANQIGTYTGADATYPQPGTVISSGKCLTVNFKSNGDSVLTSSGVARPNAMGWNATVKASPIANIRAVEIVTMADIKPFTSTNYPSNYLNNEHSIWRYCPSSTEQGIWAVFPTDISLETNVDYLYVYDGNSTNAPILNTYTGGFTQSGNTFTATNSNRLRTIKATETNLSGCLTFKFVSNGSNTFGGWNAQITTGPKRFQGSATGEDCDNAINIPYVSGTRTYAGRNFNATANPNGGTFATLTPGGQDPQLDIVGCVGGNITRLESSVWYKFTAPNVICTGDILVKLDNVSNQNYNGSEAGVQVAVYQTSGSCFGGTGWESSLNLPPLGSIKKYCQDKVTSQTPSINLRPFLQPNKTYYILIDGFNGQHTNFDIVVKIGGDTDNDGVCDTDDIDDDNDGIVDVIESGCNPGQVFALGCLARNPSEDADNDGILNYMDNFNNDLNNNYIANETFAEIQGVLYASSLCGGLNSRGVCNVVADFDGDGVPNFLDLDSDGDGLLDLREAGGTDNDGNGMVDCLLSGLAICDSDGDGLPDLYDYINDDMDGNNYPDYITGTTKTNIPLPNTDYIGEANFLDIDADDDGITDNIEGQSTLGFIAITGFDDDKDGIDNGYDNYVGFGGVGAGNFIIRELPSYGTAVLPMNSDNSDTPDYIDEDSDNDSFSDLLEGHDYNHDGLINDDVVGNWANGNDNDNDGLLNAFDNNQISSRSVWAVGNGTGNCPGTSGLCIREANTSLPEWAMSNPPDDDLEPDFRDVLVVLPSSYLEFDGDWKRTDALIKWTMKTEGTDYFELQRSVDGTNFSPISTQSTNPNGEYDYLDVGAMALAPNKVYYRLKVIDFDGKSVMSSIIQLSTENENTAQYAVVSPNPAKNAIRVECFNTQAKKLKIKIFDIQGHEVYSESVKPASETYYHSILDISSLSDGVYQYMIVGEDVPLTGKFVVAKWGGE